MPLLIIHAVIAFASLITPQRATASIQRILTSIAITRAYARWLAVVASANLMSDLETFDDERP
ncbi:hypothetical protein R1CP_39730 (plasmid) [Rhodococcus opacus]|uniref:Uncharacterized protein n=1 Tax=Rhodococcus opacus TaxID=37919 RepID=A0A1B1KIT8_RHOOP|nr:hypothetical protein R1CP_39730 [Rhodococcus opacus]